VNATLLWIVGSLMVTLAACGLSLLFSRRQFKRIPWPYRRYQAQAKTFMPGLGAPEMVHWQPEYPGERRACVNPECHARYLSPGQIARKIPMTTGGYLYVCDECAGTPRMRAFQ
jgi:hypothetical protein